MKKSIGSYPRVCIEEGGRVVVSQAGGVLLVETVRKAGLDTSISAALAPWRKDRAVHDPGRILLDVALAVALGGDCLADVGRAGCSGRWPATRRSPASSTPSRPPGEGPACHPCHPCHPCRAGRRPPKCLTVGRPENA